MSPRRSASPGTLLDLWRPPREAGNPVGCLATTYTFQPAVFDEHCLARFLEIESEPDRESLAFLLDRERRLGITYAGVIVDHTQSGVEHSFRWDVLPARIPRGKQHSKLSLLVWERAIRVIVTSANLTEQGYRLNQEVAGQLEFTPESSAGETLTEATQFLRRLLRFVPGASGLPSVIRGLTFLDDTDRRARRWSKPRRSATTQHLVFTMPGDGPGRAKRSSLDEALDLCRAKGGAPDTAWVASPFFDDDDGAAQLTQDLCRSMARGVSRELYVAVPVARDQPTGVVRVLAPRTLLTAPARQRTDVTIEMLPDRDTEKNPRVWHAKMLEFRHGAYSALMVGSSNFTLAGMGKTDRRNVEANLLTIVRYERFARDEGQLESIWPDMTALAADEAEWCGARAEAEEEEQAATLAVPAGFLSAVYRAGNRRIIVVHVDPGALPAQWTVRATGHDEREIIQSRSWLEAGAPPIIENPWAPVHPPERLLVQWQGHEAFMPLNVEDGSELPPPIQVENMTADDVLGIIAAVDPSAAFRAWARTQRSGEGDDDELDSALAVDLDPLRRYDLQATFLHRVRRRARVFAQLRANLERSVSSQQALEWRLRGMVGVEALADRMLREFLAAVSDSGERLLTLADLLIMLREVDYRPADNGALKKEEFDAVFSRFLRVLLDDLSTSVEAQRDRVPEDLWPFWQRVVSRSGKRE